MSERLLPSFSKLKYMTRYMSIKEPYSRKELAVVWDIDLHSGEVGDSRYANKRLDAYIDLFVRLGCITKDAYGDWTYNVAPELGAYIKFKRTQATASPDVSGT